MSLVQFDSSNDEQLAEQMILYFENVSACNLVFNAISENKKQQKVFMETLINTFFQDCIDKVSDDL